MKRYTFGLLMLAMTVPGSVVIAQDDDEMTDYGPDTRISVGISIGTLSYFGEIGYGTNKDLVSFATERRAFALTGHKRLNENFGVQGNLTMGNLSKGERSKLPGRNMNFKSIVVALDGQFVFHFDNDMILPSDVGASPFVSAGIGFMYFNPKGDLTLANGTAYHYWSTGEIKNKAEDAPDASSAKDISRDYVYETVLDSTSAHGNMTVMFPITAGVRLKITENIEADVKGTLHLTLSDYIDNYSNPSGSGGGDMYSFLGFSLRYFLPEF
ncbi:MAG: hypothetical protein KDD36_03770 [Flavobacteriales bacterium]|nr:hypothetical protein [Flavobacteriales bacterium]